MYYVIRKASAMELFTLWLCLILLVSDFQDVNGYKYSNYTGDTASRQTLEFKRRHPLPIGLHTTSAGEPVEVRDSITLNSDQFTNQNHLDIMTHFAGERTPERVVHARGTGAFGYFQVTHDVSKYTSADVFNGVGKKTPLFVRFSKSLGNLGQSELGRDLRGFAVKFYTKEGNLDLLCLQIPVYQYKDPQDFPMIVRARRRNPRTNLLDSNTFWDFLTLKPVQILAFLWLQSDYGSPNGYRKMDAFPIHTYELSNRRGETHYVKFNFRSEQGLDNLTNAQNMAISAEDPEYYTRDLYNAIEEKRYPSWRLEIDVMDAEEIKNLNYNPFDLLRQWKKGTYKTIPIGRLVVDRNVENNFKDSEQSALSPGNLVPGIPGPVDLLFNTRRFTYLDTQNYRLGRNHNKIGVNAPDYAKTYNRDGVSPLRENMRDAPNYYPNSFNGPVPKVDQGRPKRKLSVLENTAIDLEPSSDFYNRVLESDEHRQRVGNNFAETLQGVLPSITKRALELLTQIDLDLGKRTTKALRKLNAIAKKQSDEERYNQRAQCFESNAMKVLEKHTCS